MTTTKKATTKTSGGSRGGGSDDEGVVCHFELLEELEGFNADFEAGSSVFLWRVSYVPPTAEQLQRTEYDPETGDLPLFDATTAPQ